MSEGGIECGLDELCKSVGNDEMPKEFDLLIKCYQENYEIGNFKTITKLESKLKK